MKIFNRYFTLEFLKVFIFALIGFVVLFSVFHILEVMKIDSGADRIHTYLYILYSIPQILSHVVPAALLFGVSFAVTQFTVSRELVAIQAAGVSYYRSIQSVLITGAVMTLAMFFFQNFVVKTSNRLAQDEMSRLKKNKAVVKNIVWQKNIRGKNGYYFIYFFDHPTQQIKGGFNYLELDEQDRPRRMIQAQKAIYNQESGDWTLLSCEILNLSSELKEVSVEEHQEYRIRFPEDINFFSNPSQEPSEMNILELSSEIERRRKIGVESTPYEVQFHSDLAFPFMCLIVSIVGAIMGGQAKLRSSGPLVRSILISAAVMFFYTLVFNMSKNMGSSGVVSPIVAGWTPTTFFMLTSLGMVYRFRK